MSSMNGDKSRFHRERKQKLARRKRNRELLKMAPTQHKSSDATPRVKSGSVPA